MMENKASQLGSIHKKEDTTYNPQVSIITPVLNGIKYLEICIQSVLNQGYPYIEHIFVDGGSSDGTLDMLSNYKAEYPDRIKFVSELDRGIGEAVNKGLTIARGGILAWLDSDDVFEPDAIMTVVKFFKSNADAYFVFGDCNIINEAGEVTGKRLTKDYDAEEAIKDRHYIFLPSVFYKREVIEKVGLFNTLGNDLDFYIRVGEAFQLHRIEKTLAKYRVHKARITISTEPSSRNTMRNRFREDYILCRQHGGSIFSPRVRRYLIYRILDKLQIYCFANVVILPKLRRYPFTNKLLRIVGI